MPLSIQNYFDFNSIYQKISSYAPSESSLSSAKIFLWNRKEWVLAGTIVVGLIILKIVHYIRSRPQYPDVEKKPAFTPSMPKAKPLPTIQYPLVEMKSSLNKAALKISMPKEEPVPPNVTLTFAVDVSGSMGNDGRAVQVIEALSQLLKDAQQAVAQKNANIYFAVTVFDTMSQIHISATKITSDIKQNQSIRERVDQMRFDGGTDLLAGLEGATKQLEAMVKANQQALHVLVFLTDGDVDDKTIFDEAKLAAIRSKLASCSAELFTIGIGEKHDASKLRKMVARGTDGFQGTYINSASGEDTIGTAIARIYKHAISSFRDLQLTAQGLDASAWSILPGIAGQKIGSLTEGSTLTKNIAIHADRLKASLDLSTVKFKLTFTDPRGQKGEMTIPWDPNFIVDPAIVKVG